MKNHKVLIALIILLPPILAHAQGPLQHIDRIVCPTQEQLNVYNPTRVGPHKIRYWFGGKFFQWTPMAIDAEQAGPYTELGEKSAPQLQALSISLTPDSSSNFWTISCSYQADGSYSTTNQATTTLTVKAKTCQLDAVNAVVSCNN